MRKGLLVIVALIAIVFYASIFVVVEGERGIVLQFGKVKREQGTELPTLYGPGLHFKVPMIDQVRKLTRGYRRLMIRRIASLLQRKKT